MKTPLEIAREEAAQARANAERAREAAERTARSIAPESASPSGLVAMTVAAAHSASLAATAASEAAAHALSIAESEAPSSSSFQGACLIISTSLRAAIEAAQAAVAAMGVFSSLPGTSLPPAPVVSTAAQGEKRCAFCGRTEQASRLVAGPQVYICEECVKLCARVLGLDIR